MHAENKHWTCASLFSILHTSHITTRKITYMYIQLVHYARYNINGMQLITYTRAQQLKTWNTNITNTPLNQCIQLTDRHTFSVMTVTLSRLQKLRRHNPHSATTDHYTAILADWGLVGGVIIVHKKRPGSWAAIPVHTLLNKYHPQCIHFLLCYIAQKCTKINSGK